MKMIKEEFKCMYAWDELKELNKSGVIEKLQVWYTYGSGIIVVVAKVINSYTIGVSSCSLKDKYKKKEGREIAAKRCLDTVRSMINDNYERDPILQDITGITDERGLANTIQYCIDSVIGNSWHNRIHKGKDYIPVLDIMIRAFCYDLIV